MLSEKEVQSLNGVTILRHVERPFKLTINVPVGQDQGGVLFSSLVRDFVVFCIEIPQRPFGTKCREITTKRDTGFLSRMHSFLQ